jgi:hypothetical protein
MEMSIFGVGPVDMHDRQEIIFRVCHERTFLEYCCNLIHHDKNGIGHQLDTVLSFGNHCLIT